VVHLQWAAVEGWNPGKEDGQAFEVVDRQAFLCGIPKESDATRNVSELALAVISAAKYSPSFAFVGFFIVRPSERKRGFGAQIWAAAMHRLATVPVVGLDAVLAQVHRYQAAGFAIAHSTTRHGGRVSGVVPPVDSRVRIVGPDLVDRIVEYDLACFPARRESFLRAWVGQRYTVALLDDDVVLAWGTVRPCQSGWKIGPLFADTPDAAELVFCSLACHAGPNAELYLDTPEPNTAAVSLAVRHGLVPTFTCARMYRCTPPATPPTLPLDRTFGLTSFEFG